MTKSPDPGGKFTLFDLLPLAGGVPGALLGVWLGVWSGHRYGALAGWLVGVPAFPAGMWLGSLPGRLIGDRGVMSLFRELDAMETPALRERLAEQHSISHLALMILLHRGENRRELGLEVLGMLRAESSDVRFSGRRALRMSYPELAPVLERIDPFQPPEAYADKINEMESILSGSAAADAG
jgi:hypothetical protein